MSHGCLNMFEYKSPKNKLLKFFESSRDSWKNKAKRSKNELRNMACKLKYHQYKHAEMKAKNKELNIKITQLLHENETLGKKSTLNPDVFSEPVARHSYSIGHT